MSIRNIYRPPTKLPQGNVFYCLCLSVQRERVPHVTITHDALDLTVQIPIPAPAPPKFRHGIALQVTSGGHHWRPVQT